MPKTTILRNTFENIEIAGVWLGNLNALDIWVWYSRFINCARGISTDPGGAGNFRAYGNYFSGSTVGDMVMKEAGIFSARYNTSLNSNRFLEALGSGNPAKITVQGNTILNPVQSTAIVFRNQGPALVVDNIIRSLAGATAPIVFNDNGVSDLITVGNTFTVAAPVASNGRLLDQGSTVVTRASLAGLGAPTLPATPQRPAPARTVYEVPVGANAATIQGLITTAHTSGGPGAIVHFRNGQYDLNATLTLPAHTTIQLVGDNPGDDVPEASKLNWIGAAGQPMIDVLGPSHAQIRNLGIVAAGGKAIRVSGVDQVGAVVRLEHVILKESTQQNLWAEELDHALIDMRDTVLDAAQAPGAVSLLVEGGPLAQAGTPGLGRTNLYSGANSNNVTSYSLTQKGTLLARDVWYETNTAEFGFLNFEGSAGTFTFEGGKIAGPADAAPPPFIVLNNFAGKATFLTSQLEDRMVLSGTGTGAQILVLGWDFSNYPEGLVPTPWTDTTSPPADARRLRSRSRPPDQGGATVALANIGAANASFITTMLAQTRGEIPVMTYPPRTAGISHLILSRVTAKTATVGLHLAPGGAAAPEPEPLGRPQATRGMLLMR